MLMKSTLYSIYLSFLIFLSTLQDLPLVNYFGEIGRNPIIFFLPIFLLFELKFLRYPIRSKFLAINIIFFVFILLYLIVSGVNVVWWYYNTHSLFALGENVIIKTFKVLLYYISLFLFLRHVYFIALKVNNIKKISTSFFAVLIAYTFILISEYFNIPNAFAFYHASPPPYYRIRLLTAESSWTGSIVMMLVVGSLLSTSRPRLIKTSLVILFIGLYLILTTSKLFLINIVLALFIYFLYEKKNVKIILAAGFITILASTFILPKAFRSLENDVENFTSVVTRSSALINSFYVAAHFPFGTGGLYYVYFIKYVNEPASAIADLIGGKTDEIMNWGSREKGDRNISPSSEFGQWTIMLGLPGLILISYLYYILFLASKSNRILLIGFFYLLCTSILSETIMTKPNVFVLWALILSINFINSNKLKIGRKKSINSCP